MSELSTRQKEILGRVVEVYVATTLPVGSRTLAERYDFNLSPASLRHELGLLEDLGYLTHPHTSAGRVPTDQGYRFYVRQVVIEENLSEALASFITREMEKKIENLENLMERASQILSAIAEEAVLILSPKLRELCLKELNPILLDPNQLLVVWCTTSGLVQTSLVTLNEPISLDEVERIRHFINEELLGAPIDSLEDVLLRRIRSRQDSLRHLYERTLEILQESLSHWTRPRVFVEGSRYMLNQPEFQDVKRLRSLMETLEEKSSLIDLLSQQPGGEGVHVAIGEEELSKAFWDCSLVSSPYPWQGKYVGTVAILGPRRMPYGRMMGLVHYMAEKMGETLSRWGS